MLRFFGIVRCFKGDEDHPSITQFSQIYRLLSLYTPLKTAIKGNCTGPCDSVLVSFQDSLGSKAKAAAELKNTIESKLHKKLQCIISFPDENDTQDSSNCSVQDMVVYYLCGYVHRKMEKVTTCKDCLASLTSTPEEYAAAPKPHESALTQLRSFKEGCLRHPSRSLFSTIKAIEKAAQEAFDENTIVGDLFWIVLEKLEWFPLPSLGCTAHDQDMMARVVKFYIVMRMFFFCKKSNQKLQLSEKVKNARKKVKLL